MFAAVPVAFAAFALHYWTTGYIAIAGAGALCCFFTGWFFGRRERSEFRRIVKSGEARGVL
jgi:hypothetical protein